MARSADDPRLCFKALYHDELSGITREFQLKFYFNDQSVELTDMGTRKVFLKRTESRNLETADFVLGKTVVVFGRLLHLTEYMDVVTRQLCEGMGQPRLSATANATAVAGGGVSSSAATSRLQQQQKEQCGTCYVFVERSKFFTSVGKVLSVLDVELGFTVTGITAGTLPAAAVAAASKEMMATDEGGAMMGVGGADAAANLKALCGKMLCCFRLAKAGCNASVAEVYRRLCPSAYGGGPAEGPFPPAAHVGLFAVAVRGTASPMESVFEAIATRSAGKYLSGAAAVGSVIIIKPHLLLRKAAGDVIQVVLEQSGGELVGMALVNLSSRDATSMMAAYRGVLPDFHGTTLQMSSGAAIALHITSKRTAALLAAEDAYRDQCEPSGAPSSLSSSSAAAAGGSGSDLDIFLAARALCGPFDPTIAKALRSSTIRARYGVDRSLNAVHCCDIEEDVASVSKFVFAFVAVRKLLDPSSECS